MNAKLRTILDSLTPLEIKALAAAWKSSRGNGHDFGFSDDVKVAGCNGQQNGALMTNLLTKGLMWRDEAFGQIMFNHFDGENDGSGSHVTGDSVEQWLIAKGEKL